MKVINFQSGALLIEILLVIALAAIMLPALLTGLFTSSQGKAQQKQRVEAVALLKEGEEIVRNIREKDWSSFSTNGTYHPVTSNNAWDFASGSEIINGITRTITISDVYRDANGVLVTSGGTIDPSSKRVYIQLSWGDPYPSSVDSTIFVTRHLSNAANTQTTLAEFSAGTTVNTDIVNTSGGEITLLSNNKAKWCSPSLSSATISLPDGPPVAVAATVSASVTNPNSVFVATAPTTATSVKLAFVHVTANADPPVPSLKGIFTLDAAQYSAPGLIPSGVGLDNNFKTNDVKYYKSSSGKMYALLATDKPDTEIVAVLVDDNDSSNDNTNNGEYQDYVNGIYKYWTFFNTSLYSPSTVLSTPLEDPSGNSADSGGDGDGFASNSTRAYSDNSSFAVDSNSGNNTGTNCTGGDKDKHRYYNYGFNVPSGATIHGIEVHLDARVDSTSNSPFMCVQLSWDGGSTWTTTKSTSTLTTNEATYTLGGASDNWGRTWNNGEFSNSNFRVRVINVASSTSRDFSLDWAPVKVYYSGGSLNDQAPFGYGATSVAVLGNMGYMSSGGYLYTFDLSNIDSKTTASGLDMVGCRIQLDGYDCNPGSGTNRKYSAGQTGTSWGDTTSPAHNDCSDGGNIELYASNDIYPVQVGANTYVYVAVGAGTNPEFDIVNVSSIPDGNSSPAISNSSCGRISGGNASWKVGGTFDFNSNSGTEEAANSVFANSDGTRAYISSNGGIDGNGDGQGDSKQFYILNTSTKTAPAFLSGTPSSGPSSGFYYGTGANAQQYPRRSLTVLNGQRAVLVGKDGITDANDAEEYQVLNINNEATPLYCSGIDFDQGFNDLTSVSEADTDNFVYMVANTTVNELKIIQGGPDGTYLESGTYESSTQDIGSVVALNRLTTTTSLPANTNILYQVAATLPISGSCSGVSFNYVGPDGTAGSYFPSTGGQIPFSSSGGFVNPAQCVRYKAFLSTTDYNVTPQLLDASINYSP